MTSLVWTRPGPNHPLTARGLGGDYEVETCGPGCEVWWKPDSENWWYFKGYYATPAAAQDACEAHHAARLAATPLPERAKPSRWGRLRAWLRARLSRIASAMFPPLCCCVSCRRPCDDLHADPAGGSGGYCKECRG